MQASKPQPAWAAVLFWCGILVLESSDFGSSAHTGAFLLKIWTAVLGRPDPKTFETVHHLIRKTGHFTGYAILSWLLFIALRATWRQRNGIVLSGRAYYWQLRWALLGILVAALAGSLDEFHQSFNPARTARWQDVVIDTSGALVLQALLFLVVMISKRSRPAEKPTLCLTEN